jgi:hypothetical protein
MTIGSESPNLDECWEWHKDRNGKGYGRASFNGTREFMHRLLYKLAHGPIPPGMDVCHRCDNPPCCNPSHLFIGTRSQNLIDAAIKKRWARQHNTHCPHGHELTPENIIKRSGDRSRQRECLTCARERMRRRKQAQTQEVTSVS